MLSRIADTSFRLATNPVVTRQVLPAPSVALRRLAPHLASRGMHVATRRHAQPTAPSPTRTARRDIQIGRDNGNLNPVLLFVPSAQEWMIERFGKYHRTAGPGLSVAIPLLEKVAYKRSLKESTLAIHPMTAITKDNVHVSLDGAVYVKCHDTYAASYEIGEPEDAIRILAQSCMRKEVGNLELDELNLRQDCDGRGFFCLGNRHSNHSIIKGRRDLVTHGLVDGIGHTLCRSEVRIMNQPVNAVSIQDVHPMRVVQLDNGAAWNSTCCRVILPCRLSPSLR